MRAPFELPYDNQSSSTFLQQPTDVLKTILRTLLLPSSAAENGKLTETGEDRPYLSAQLLRCCQMLYVEGREILYHENRLHINLYDGRAKIEECSLITYDTEDDIPASFYPFGTNQPDLSLSDLGAQLVEVRKCPIDERSVLNIWVPGQLDGMLQIRRIEVHFACSSRRYFWDWVRMLREVVSKKEVIIHWEYNDSFDGERARDLLRSLYQWRCEKLTFKGLPSNLESPAAAMGELIMSRKPVIDLWANANGLYKFFDGNSTFRGLQINLERYTGESSDSENEYASDQEAAARNSRNKKRRRGNKELADMWDVHDLWTMIRRCDTAKFALWQRRMTLLMEQAYAEAS